MNTRFHSIFDQKSWVTHDTSVALQVVSVQCHLMWRYTRSPQLTQRPISDMTWRDVGRIAKTRQLEGYKQSGAYDWGYLWKRISSQPLRSIQLQHNTKIIEISSNCCYFNHSFAEDMLEIPDVKDHQRAAQTKRSTSPRGKAQFFLPL